MIKSLATALLLVAMTPITVFPWMMVISAPAPSGVAAQSWLSSMLAVWTCEESAGSTIDNVEGTAGNDFPDENTLGRSNTDYMQGSQSCSFTAASSGQGKQWGANMTELNRSNADSTVAMWSKVTNDASNTRLITVGGAELTRESANDRILGSWGASTYSSNNSDVAGTWYHVALVWDSSQSLESRIFMNGALNGDANRNSFTACTSCWYYFGEGSKQSLIDEAVYDDAAWTATEACRVANCGIAGEKCVCSGSDNTAYMACNSNTDCQAITATALCSGAGGTCNGRAAFGGCSGTMAACNAAAPS